MVSFHDPIAYDCLDMHVPWMTRGDIPKNKVIRVVPLYQHTVTRQCIVDWRYRIDDREIKFIEALIDFYFDGFGIVECVGVYRDIVADLCGSTDI